MTYGPCVKQQVFCTIIATNGNIYVGENHCRNPQNVCPRADMPSGVGYELCKSVCDQVGHAEVVAISLAGVDSLGSSAYLEGHTYVCDSCKSALNDAGVSEVYVSTPPK